MDKTTCTVSYCPYQKRIITEVSIPKFGTRSDVTKVIETSVTFGKCLRSNCPFYSESSFPNCKRAIMEAKLA